MFIRSWFYMQWYNDITEYHKWFKMYICHRCVSTNVCLPTESQGDEATNNPCLYRRRNSRWMKLRTGWKLTCGKMILVDTCWYANLPWRLWLTSFQRYSGQYGCSLQLLRAFLAGGSDENPKSSPARCGGPPQPFKIARVWIWKHNA